MLLKTILKFIIHSPVWQQPYDVRIVWATMVMLADRSGVVEGPITRIAMHAAVPLPAAEQCIAVLTGAIGDEPQVEPCDDGWRILNFDPIRKAIARERALDSKRDYARRMRQEWS